MLVPKHLWLVVLSEVWSNSVLVRICPWRAIASGFVRHCCSKIPQSIRLIFLFTSGTSVTSIRVNLIALWSDSDGTTSTLQFVIASDMPEWCPGPLFCLPTKKVGSWPLLHTTSRVDTMNSHSTYPMALVSEDPHTVLCALASPPIREFRYQAGRQMTDLLRLPSELFC